MIILHTGTDFKMKRKAGGQAANSPEGAVIPISNENRNSTISSSSHNHTNSIDHDNEHQRREYEAKVRKSLDLSHLVNYLRELCNQEESESESESSDNGTSSYLPSSPLSGLVPGGSIHNNSSVFGLLSSDDCHHSQADGFGRAAHDTHNTFGPVDLLNENSSSTISDDHLRYNSNQSRAASKVGKTMMFNSAPVSLISSARSSINGSVTTKSSYSSSNSTLSDEDSSQRLDNESHDSSSEDEQCANNSDSDADSALPLSDFELCQLLEASKSCSSDNGGLSLSAKDQQTSSIHFIDTLYAASGNSRRKTGTTAKNKLKKLFGLRGGEGGKLAEAVRNRIRKKSLSLKTEQTIAGAMSTFKTPMNFGPGKVVPAIKLEPLDSYSKTLKVKHEQTDVTSPTTGPAKKRRKKLSPNSSSHLDDTSSLNEQVMDMNTSQSTVSLDSYFKTENKLSISTKARSTSSTSSLEGLKSKKLSPQRKLELLNLKRKKIYVLICKRDVPKAYKNRLSIRNEKIAAAKMLGFAATQAPKDELHQRVVGIKALISEQSSDAGLEQQSLTFHSVQEDIGPEEEAIPTPLMNEIVKFCHLSTRQKLLYDAIQTKIMELLTHRSSSTSTKSESGVGQAADKQMVRCLAALKMVCNHPELLSAQNKIRSPFRHQLNIFYPKLIFLDTANNFNWEHLYRSKFFIYHPHNIHSSIFQKVQPEDLNMATGTIVHSPWSFTRFIELHLSEPYDIFYGKFGSSLQHFIKLCRSQDLAYKRKVWLPELRFTSKSSSNLLLIEQERTTSKSSIDQSSVLKSLIFTSGVSSELDAFPAFKIPPLLHNCYNPKVSSKRMKVYFRGVPNSAVYGVANNWSQYSSEPKCTEISESFSSLFGREAQLLNIAPSKRFSEIIIPKTPGHVKDSGKLQVLEELLKSLKATQGHRVVILSQLPEMIEILQRYLKSNKWLMTDNFVELCLTSQTHKLTNEKMNDSVALDSIIFVDSSYCELEHQKAAKNIQRVSTSNAIIVYRLICKDTIEADISSSITQANNTQESEKCDGTHSLNDSGIISLITQNQQISKEDIMQQIEIELKANNEISFTESKMYGQPRGAVIEKPIPTPSTQATTQATYGGNESENEDTNGDCSSDADEESDDCDKFDQSTTEKPTSSKYLTSYSLDFESSDDEELAMLPRPKKISRGMGKRGRPPTRIRFSHQESRDYDGRRPGRPRLKPFGPQNQVSRGRGPGRPPLIRRMEPYSTHLPVHTHTANNQSIFEYHSSSEPDSS